MSFTYSVFGLRLDSNCAIPGLVVTTTTNPEVKVWFDAIPLWLEKLLSEPQQDWYCSPFRGEYGEPILRTWKLSDDRHLRLLYRDGTQFIVDLQGTEIWATWPDNLTLEDTATYLLGPVLGFVLRLRGVTCLHASAVVVEDRAIALLGVAGAGKSTTAAAFAKMGYPVLSDDVAALVDEGDRFLVQPAYPRIRLWSQSVNTLYSSPDALPRIVPTHPTWDKRYLDLTQEGYYFQQQPLPLAAIYVLSERCERSDAPSIESMTAHTKLMTLIANTYTNYLLDKSRRAQEFEVLQRLLLRVPIQRLIPHSDPVYLPKLCEAIINDFQSLNFCY
jgi:hypothetical protein